MTETSTYSTLFLTLLMMIGLFFFIRASTKDRTETLTLQRPDTPAKVLQEMTAHFENRAYAVQSTESDRSLVRLRGMVRPSLFLALFLTFLAAIGMLCLALVLASLFPNGGLTFLGLTVLAPAAGLYYWQRAGREEEVTFQVTSATSSPEANSTDTEKSQVTVRAHRDELIALQQALKTL